ncbi:MAG: response regulator [Ekhidna sp.]|uniref:ATP-binding protein n=1 Tax=Ekhidna sp. TaxID=2608089 RepID=UPI0032EF0C08
MLKKSILTLITFLLISQADAQLRQFLDSLKNDLATVTDDSLRMRVLDELAWTYKRVNADSALMYGKMGLEIANQMDPAFQATLLATIGVTKNENGIGDFGVSELRQALEISESLGDKRRIASNYTNLGNSFESQGRYDSSIYYTTKAIALKLEVGDSMSAAGTMGNLALAYEGIGNVDKALSYLNEALKIMGPAHPRAKGILHNIGLMQMKKGDYEAARSSFMKSIKGRSLSDNKSTFSSIYGNLGITYLREEKYDSALYYTLASYNLKREIGQQTNLLHPIVTLCKIYLNLNQFDKARTYGKIGLDILEENPSLDHRIELLRVLSRIETKSGNYEAGFKYYDEYDILKDSLLSKSVLQAAEEAEAKFQNALKEKENLILREEAQIQNQQIRFQSTVIISIISIVVLLIIIAMLFRKQLNERKKLLRKIEAQAEKLKELDQAKTRFFANISHDLRSPLTLILGSLDKITERDYEVLDKESRELLDMGIKNGKRLLYLADEIMDLTRLEEGKVTLDLEYVKIVPYLRLLTKMFSSAADIKNIELRFSSYAEDETTLQIDPHQFEKIIYNLLSNAIKFTPEKGTVDVELNAVNSHVEISISDSGPGIPKESLELIFDRYYQSSSAKSSQAGVGIGLALVKELVELHGGTIKATSGKEGSVFTIQFPFKKSDWVSKAIIPERSLDVVTRNSLWMDLQEERERLQIPGIKNADQNAKAVLIVEDHKELRTYLQSILNSNFRIYLAANGANALELLQSEKIDLIITDLMMPYMDGFELVDHLKNDKELKKIPVMVVSARTDKKEKLDLISKGAEDVISKPFDKEELLAKIQNILGRDWDSSQTLTKLYGETVEEFERNVMHRLETLIIKRIDDPHLSVLDLADEMAASERKVYRMIKKISGLTPYELIKEVRWQYLENYLKNNKVKTATEAAQIIGMSNASSFSNQFEKRFGYPFREAIS